MHSAVLSIYTMGGKIANNTLVHSYRRPAVQSQVLKLAEHTCWSGQAVLCINMAQLVPNPEAVLDFENQTFIELLSEDGLIIMARYVDSTCIMC